MRIGLVGLGARRNLSELLEDARTARDDGFSTYWLSQDTTHDPLTAIALMGREIPEIKFGTSIPPTFLRHPKVLATQALTVQEATEGRLLLNIGPAAPPNRDSYFGYVFDQPITHMRRLITVLRRLLNGEAVDTDSPSLDPQGQIDINVGAPLVLMTAFKPTMVRFAGEQADGIFTWLVGHRTLSDYVVPEVTRAASEAQRISPRVMAAVAVCVTSKVKQARASAAERLEIFNGLSSYKAMLAREGVLWAQDLFITGEEDEVTESLLKYAKAGATDLVVAELCPDATSARRTRKLLTSLANR